MLHYQKQHTMNAAFIPVMILVVIAITYNWRFFNKKNKDC